MPEPGKIDALWREYRADVLPKDASVMQIVACRRAFFAGAVALWKIMVDSTEEGVTSEAVADLKAANVELAAYWAAEKAKIDGASRN